MRVANYLPARAARDGNLSTTACSGERRKVDITMRFTRSVCDDEALAELLAQLKNQQRALTMMGVQLRLEVQRSGANSPATLALAAARKSLRETCRAMQAAYVGCGGQAWNEHRKNRLYARFLQDKRAEEGQVVQM